jgi:hypothetical protein
MTKTYKVRVFINRAENKFRRFPGGYAYGDPLVQALEFECENESVNAVLDRTFHALNIDPGYLPDPSYGSLTKFDIIRYHKRFPSLSVSDVVEVDGYKYACEPVGWKAIGLREVICEVCRRRAPVGDHLEICADCRQLDYGEFLAEREEANG